MRVIVTFGAATSALALFIYALQQQQQSTQAALPSPANASGSWSAFNTSSAVLGDVTVPLSNGLPLALGFAFVVSVLVLAYGVSGR